MVDSLTGEYADRFEIASTARTDATTGRPIFEIRLKQGASVLPFAGTTLTAAQLAVSRSNAAGGVATPAIAMVISVATLALANQALSVPENATAGQQLGGLAATGGSGTKVYSVGAGSNGAIVISPSGVITVAADVLGAVLAPTAFDFEAAPSFTVPVQVSDDSGVATATLTINLTNANESPSAQNIEVSIEDTATAIGTVISALPAISDPDAGDTHQVTILSGNTDGDFSISGNSLITTQPLLFSRTNSYILNLRAVDSGGLTGFFTVTITVSQGNQPPTLTLTNTVTSIPEDVAISSARKLADIVIAEVDGGQGTNALSLSGADAALFELVGNQLFASQNSFFPTTDSPFTVTVVSTDSSITETSQVAFSLTSSAANTAPTAANVVTTVSDDVSPGFVISELSPIDTDPNAVITAEITSGNNNLQFGLTESIANTTWRLTTIAALDAITTAFHSVLVTFTDQYGASSNTVVGINVVEALSITTASLATIVVPHDGANGATVATLVAEGGTAPRNWSKSGGTADLNIATDGTVTIGDITSFVGGTFYSLAVLVEDAQGAVRAANLNVSATEAPAEPPVINDASIVISATTPLNTLVHTMVQQSGEVVTSWQFQVAVGILGSQVSPWEINASGEIRNFAAIGSGPYSLTVSGSNGTGSDTAALTINIAQPVALADASYSLAENPSNGQAIATLAATGGTPPLTYALVAGGTAPTGALAVASTGELTVADPSGFDFEGSSPNPMTITAEVTDAAATPSSDTATITVSVTDANEAPTAISGGPFTIATTVTAGTGIGSILVTDPDASGITGGAFSILSGDPDGLLSIDSAGLLSRSSSGTATATTLTPVIQFTDAGGLSISGSVSVTFDATALQGPTVSLSSTSSSLPDTSSTAGSRFMASVSSTNPEGGTLVFAVSDTTNFELTSVTASSAQLRLKAGVTLDAVATPTLSVDVTVNDAAIAPSPNDSETYTLTLTAVQLLSNSATFYQPATGDFVPLIASSANINAQDKDGNPVTVEFTSLANATITKVSDGSTLAANTPVSLADIHRGEYYFSAPSGAPAWSLEASTSRGTSAPDTASLIRRQLSADISAIAAQGVSDYATAEATFASAVDETGLTNGTQYYYNGTDGFAAGTVSIDTFYGSSWFSVYLVQYGTSAPGTPSTAISNSFLSDVFYIQKEATRWRLYQINGARTAWTEITTA